MRIVLDCFCLIICYFLEILNLNRPFAVCNRYFWDLSLKIYSLPTFNMLFQFVIFQKQTVGVFTRKLITWSTHAKGLLQLDRWSSQKSEFTDFSVFALIQMFNSDPGIRFQKKSDWNNAWPKHYEQRLLRTRADTPLKDSFFFLLLLGNKNPSPFYCWYVISVLSVARAVLPVIITLIKQIGLDLTSPFVLFNS